MIRLPAARRPTRLSLCLLALAAALAGCNAIPPAPAASAALDAECESPRPEICTREYRPVCGLVDTALPCVSRPCPAPEWKTYGNACTACSNREVTGYRRGECAPDADD